ncbi:nucleotidyl transferase AbiEii/AbiGii toxin family protein [Dyadobacter sp. CY261]|uniref:nucleotidyl transferase AbiEii/AbiGii toxin family protein n=1 Tax=Dyadobacter sp. CY261 TaxID=2907203 RepID=UPI001F38A5AB|nr:nucleotidyl transferase AbiEii/AbiGii toxin family protein [Dyadobacter sp. CY261]MCF0075738.1 nucleotidyl transferase AbiEii/AbiGii toxin family protein [Dyadobacter sp. CY261]
MRSIGEALERIKESIENGIPRVHVQHKRDVGKLLISVPGAEIKLEVNLVGRGCFKDPVKMHLCARAQEEFDVFNIMSVVPFGQLFGGKICAALDRQHPRDLFDIKYLLNNEGFSDEVRQGFLFCLLGSDRPMNEVLVPNFQDQRLALANQFSGMSAEEFSYEEYDALRGQLVATVHESLTQSDKDFLLSFKNAEPDWSIYDFEKFPSIQWKLRNLTILKMNNPGKHREQFEILEEKLKIEKRGV